MNYILGISDQPRQHMTILLADGTKADLTLEFKPMQKGWFFDIAWSGSTFRANGQRLVSAPNILRQYIDQIPFGIYCKTANNVEPFNQTDFVTGVCQLILLDSEDVRYIDAAIFVNR